MRTVLMIFDRFMPVLAGFLLVLLIASFAAYTYNTFVAETFALRKDEWTCVSSHKTIAWTGKTALITNTCDNYVRKS